MKRYIVVMVAVALMCAYGGIYAQDVPVGSSQPEGVVAQAPAPVVVAAGPKIILLIAEQNIEGPQHAWWASEIDLSSTEAAVVSRLLERGYTVIDPGAAKESLEQKPAYRVVSITEDASAKLASTVGADYAVVGKAVATAGGNVPQSSMRSCFANVSAKLIRVRDGKVLAYLSAGGNSAHLDAVTGGREALEKAGSDLAGRIIDALAKEGGK